jgi:hypothetical protein
MLIGIGIRLFLWVVLNWSFCRSGKGVAFVSEWFFHGVEYLTGRDGVVRGETQGSGEYVRISGIVVGVISLCEIVASNIVNHNHFHEIPQSIAVEREISIYLRDTPSQDLYQQVGNLCRTFNCKTDSAHIFCCDRIANSKCREYLVSCSNSISVRNTDLCIQFGKLDASVVVRNWFPSVRFFRPLTHLRKCSA